MANPYANDAGTDPTLDTRFTQLNMSAPQMDAAAHHDDTSSLWSSQDPSFHLQSTATGFDAAPPPHLTDPILAAQFNVQQHSPEYDQYSTHYTGDPSNQQYWPPADTPAHAGPSSVPATDDKPFKCEYENCTKSYDRQCDLEYASDLRPLP